MSLAYWRDVCVLNFTEIDEEHQSLLNILQMIYQDIDRNETKTKIRSRLHELFESMLAHCETEERLMMFYSYPDYHIHTDNHEEVLNTILNLRLKAEEGEMLSLDMLHGLASWLNHHVWEYDLPLVQFIRQRQHHEELLFQ